MDQAWIKMDQEYRFPIRRGEIMLYVSICAFVVGSWALKTIEQDNDIEGLK